VDSDNEYSKNEKSVQDLLKMKTMMPMKSATGGFNIGYERAVVVKDGTSSSPCEFRQKKAMAA
jgi:hypothetical protein